MSLKLLCAAEPSDSHHLRHITLLEKAGVEVHLLDHSLDFRPGVTPARTHVAWPKSGRRTLARLVGGRAAEAVADRLVAWQLRSLWKRTGAEVCHVHWADDRVLGAANAGLRPLVLTAYGSDLQRAQLSSFDPERLARLKAGLAEIDLLIADSEDMMEIAEQLTGKKIPSLLLPIGVDIDLFHPGYQAEAAAWRAELAIPAGAKVALSPRVMLPNYRQVELVRAFAHAVRDHALDAYMVFKAYVSDPAYVEAVRVAAEDLGVADRIRVIDEVPYERLPVLYALADVAVTFAALDAFPVTFLEAGGCELPILANHLPAYDSNGMGAFLTFMSCEDEAAIGADLARICHDEAARERARAGRRHIVENLDETAFVRRLLDAYRGVLAEKAR